MTRLEYFKQIIAELTEDDVENAEDFPDWCFDWGFYVEDKLNKKLRKQGKLHNFREDDRPPVKPPHP